MKCEKCGSETFDLRYTVKVKRQATIGPDTKYVIVDDVDESWHDDYYGWDGAFCNKCGEEFKEQEYSIELDKLWNRIPY